MRASPEHANHETGALVPQAPAPRGDGRPHVAAGAGLLLLVMVLLSMPLLIAVRSARARRAGGLRAPRSTGATPDAWSESARRLGGDA